METTATFPQAKHLIEIFQTLESGQLQELFASGLLTDIRGCASGNNLAKIDRNAFRIALGLEPSVFSVKMGGPEDTDQIMASLGIKYGDNINQADLPIRAGTIPWEDKIEIIDPGCSFTDQQGLKFLAAANLHRPTYEHAIRFAQQYGETLTRKPTQKPVIVFLHKPRKRAFDEREVLAIYRGPGENFPELSFALTGEYADSCVLAGVRRRRWFSTS